MNNRGFVRAGAMEGLIVVAIIAVIAAIAIPQYTNYKNRNFNKEAKAHAYKAYEASQALFRADPKAAATLEAITQYGYKGSGDITLTISGGKDNLYIKTEHIKSNKAYKVDAKGELSTD